MRRKAISVFIAAVIILPLFDSLSVLAENTANDAAVSGYVSVTNENGSIEIVSKNKTPTIYVDNTDYEGVIRAVGDLQNDIETITGKKPSITNDNAENADIIIGTIGKGGAVDSFPINTSNIEGKWESFTIQSVENRLVIAGSDKRGTIYGIYDLCEKIGVSPWSFWADTVAGHADSLYINLPDSGYTEDEPSVKYRGIFLNDEFNMSEWSKSMSSTGKNMNNETYEKIFELLLRLKANYLWPAMHTYSTAFNVTENNARLADEYGIVMGSSHAEPLLRNNLGELYDYQEEWKAQEENAGKMLNTKTADGKTTIKDDANRTVAYMWTDKDNDGNAVANKEFLTDYWRARAKDNSSYENTYTLGMRGVHDGGFSTNMSSQTAMQEILEVQTQILKDEVVKEGQDISDIPQVFIPYKEMLDMYNKGLQIPDYVTLMWPDDNFGYIRQLPTEEERKRSGGAGIYYHLSYYGRPTSYLWLSTTQLGLIREEMTKAYDMGAQKIWIANVGDLKPAETEIEYFLDLARDINIGRNTDIGDWLKDNAKRDFCFNDTEALEYADIKLGYYKNTGARRPEHFVNGLFSTGFGDEGQKLIDNYTGLEKRAEILYNSLSEDKKPSFYELLLYPLKGAKNMAEKYVYSDKAKRYTEMGYGSAANKYAKLSDDAYQRVVDDTAEYTSMLGAKWDKMMNPYQTRLTGSFGGTITGRLNNPSVEKLPYTNMEIASESGGDLSFTKYSTEPQYIDIINTGTGSFDWTAKTSADWITINKASGTVADDDRIYIGVDPSKAGNGQNTAYITFTRGFGNANIQTVCVNVTFDNTNVLITDEKVYIENDGYISIEAEHYTNNIKNGNYEWSVEKDFGRNSDSVKIYPDTAASVTIPNKNDSAYLEYDVYFKSAGTFPIDVYRMPTLNELSGSTMRCNIGIDDNTPVRFAGTRAAKDKSDGTDPWGKGVLQNTEIISGTIIVPSSGLHKVRLYNESPSVVIDKFVITTGEKKASYLGAPESYNTTYNNHMKPLPEPSAASETQTGNITPLFEPSMIMSDAVINNECCNAEIKIDSGNMTVTVDAPLSKDAHCYVASYKKDGTLESIIKSINIITANSDDKIFNFDKVIVKPTDGSIKTFIWTEDMQPVYNSDASKQLSVDITKLNHSVNSATLVIASYNDIGNMIDAIYKDISLDDIDKNQTKTMTIHTPLTENAKEMQLMLVSDIKSENTSFEALSPSVNINLTEISATDLYEDGCVYPSFDMTLHIGKEAICVISDETEIKYIRQSTVKAAEYDKISFTEKGKFDLKVKIAGESDIFKEEINTVINIKPDNNASENVSVYNQTFETAPSSDSAVKLNGASYDNSKKAINMGAGGKITVDFAKPITMTQGDTITTSFKIAHAKENNKFMDWTIKDSNDKSIAAIHVSAYNGTTTSHWMSIGDEKVYENKGSLTQAILRTKGGEPGGYTTYTITVNCVSGNISMTVSSDNGTEQFMGKLPNDTSYNIDKIEFSTDYTNAAKSCLVKDISITRSKEPSYNITFIPVDKLTQQKIINATVFVTDAVTGADIILSNDNYALCRGDYRYTITADGYKTVIGTLNLSPATVSKEIFVEMEKN